MSTKNIYRKKERISLIILIMIICVSVKLPVWLSKERDPLPAFSGLQVGTLDTLINQIKEMKTETNEAENKPYSSRKSKSFVPKKYTKKKYENSKSKDEWQNKNALVQKNEASVKDSTEEYTFKNNIQKPTPEYKYTLDLNTASQLELESLKGIGPTLAQRIIKFRDGLGGFYTVSQIKETYGLPIETFDAISSQLEIQTPLQKIDINEIDEKSLAKHVLFSYKHAKWITAYREQHGAYSSLEDLLKIRMIDPLQVEKWAPYLSFNELAPPMEDVPVEDIPVIVSQ